MGDLVGRNLGPYRILEQAGAGGMATVYKAYHAAMDRYVAIKVLPEHLARDAGFRARFEREARTIARLEHRYILPVHDVGEQDGIPYMVMRYIDSGDLNHLIASKSMTIGQGATLVAHVAEALAYAHRQGIIHRDVKPANILISRDGDPLLTDFGIAKIYADSVQLTGEGMMVGTPTYMAPEQFKASAVDGRADIYSLGVVLYQSLTGEPPFVAETPLAVALMHVHNPLRPPRQLNPNIPESLERIILRAMAKNPDDRFQTADELSHALHQALGELNRSTILLPAAVTADELPTSAGQARVAEPAAVAPVASPTHRVSPRVLAVGSVLLLVALLALVAFLRWPRATSTAGVVAPLATSQSVVSATPGPTSLPAAARATAGPPVVPRAGLRVFASTAETMDLVTLGDVAWAATGGGLVRLSPDGQRRVFTTADGLPFNRTVALAAAPDGALWAAGDQGIVRVRPSADGLSDLRYYTDADGFDLAELRALMVDDDGSLWAGGASYANHQISHLEGERWRGLDLPAGDPALNNVQMDVTSLLRSRDGALWVGLEHDGILRFANNSWSHFGPADGVGEGAITQLIEEQDGTIWAAAGERGLLRFDAAARRWQRVPVGRNEQSIDAISANGANLYATGAGFVAHSDDHGASWTALTSDGEHLGNVLSAVTTDANGQVWVGSDDGVSVFSAGQWRRQSPSGELPMSGFGRLAEAPNDALWAIEEYGGAAGIIDPTALTSEPIILPDTNIQAVTFSNDTTWLGTSNGIVRQRGGAQLRLTTADGLPSENIRSLLSAGSTLWIGTDNGLASYDLAADKVVNVVPEFAGAIVTTLFQAPDGALWAGSIKEGDVGTIVLGRYDGTSWQIWKPGDQPLPQDSAGVTSIAADSQGHVWVAVWNGGLHSWDGAAWRSWSAANGAPSENILVLAAHNDDLWMGGHLGGLVRWNKDGWRQFKLDGLSGDVTDARLTADGALWLATRDGLLRLSDEALAALQ